MTVSKTRFFFLSLWLGSDRYTGFRLGLGVRNLSDLQLFTSGPVFLLFHACNALYACLSVLCGGAPTYTTVPPISNELYLHTRDSGNCAVDCLTLNRKIVTERE